MSILVDENTRLLVQGITGREGMFHTEQMVQYGTQVVAGVTPGPRRAGSLRRAGVQYRGASGARDRRQRLHHLRPRPLCP